MLSKCTFQRRLHEKNIAEKALKRQPLYLSRIDWNEDSFVVLIYIGVQSVTGQEFYSQMKHK